MDATHFQLVGSTGSGTYTLGGLALDTSMTPAFQVPSDGDAFTVASINASVMALADRTQALAGRGQIGTAVFVNTTVVIGSHRLGSAWFSPSATGAVGAEKSRSRTRRARR